jgi:hypothetical protein
MGMKRQPNIKLLDEGGIYFPLSKHLGCYVGLSYLVSGGLLAGVLGGRAGGRPYPLRLI